MNLSDFLNYRTECPVCQNDLSIFFHSRKRQKTYINNPAQELIAIFTLKTLNKKPTSQIGYHINLHDNSFYVNFYDQRGKIFDNLISLQQIKKFKHLDTNHNAYQIHRHCMNCEQYNYKSNYFTLNYTERTIGDLEVQSEYFSLYQPTLDGYISYRLLNWYHQSESWLLSKKIAANEYFYDEPSELDLFVIANALSVGLIKCNHLTSEQLINKISNILLFS